MLAAFIGLLLGTAVEAENADDSLLAYAVTLNQAPSGDRWGAGIYLGNGLILSAAHVVGDRPSVTIAGQQFPARIIKKGTFEELDLALLEIDEARLPIIIRMRRVSLCQDRPWLGENVITVAPEGTARSNVISARLLPKEARRYDTLIKDVPRSGNSGSGVFDARKKCLLGIMSRKISWVHNRNDMGSIKTVDIAKYFVPAATIAQFMPGDFPFRPQ